MNREASKAGKPISLCGEHAGQALDAMTLIGCGFRSLSMPPANIPRVKAMLRSLEIGPLESYIAWLLKKEVGSLREQLRYYARDHGV